MPQSSSQQQDEWGVADGPVIRFLTSRGYTLLANYTWRLPVGRDAPDEREASAICFLIDEWDFRGLAEKEEE